MERFNTAMAIKYGTIGAGAVALPAVVQNMAAAWLANIPGWSWSPYAGITLGGVVLAAAGVWLIDTMFFSK